MTTPRQLIYYVSLLLIPIFLFSCTPATTNQAGPVVGQGSSLASITRKMVNKINDRYLLKDKNIQISENNFLEKDTYLNLPFSSVLSQNMASELSSQGAVISVQKDYERTPLRLVGTYQKAGNDMLVTIRLRKMGEASSTDLAITQDRISISKMDPNWLKPEFQRIARSLVQLLEYSYQGMVSLKVNTQPFEPSGMEPERIMGKEMSKYMKNAFASSSVFHDSGADMTLTNAILKGDYAKQGADMVFHATLVDKQTQKYLASAKISTPVRTIPYELLQSGIQSPDDLAKKLAKRLLHSAQAQSNVKASNISVNAYAIHDSQQNSITPFARNLADQFKNAFSAMQGIMVSQHPLGANNLILSGKYYKSGPNLIVSVTLHQAGSGQQVCQLKQVAMAQGEIDLQYCRSDQMESDLQGYTDLLMARLEKKAETKMACTGSAPIMINKFKYENRQSYSRFSDYINDYFLDYYTASPRFVPIKNPEKQLSQSLGKPLTRGTRTILAQKKTDAAMASIVKADYFISGSFWPVGNSDIEIKASLENTKGQLLASEKIRVSAHSFDSDWIQSTLVPEEFNSPQTDLSVALFTQKGRDNLIFRQGEEIIFFAKANQNAYLKIFTRDAENHIYQVFPNAFISGQTMLNAGDVTSIPNENSDGFAFQVVGTTGNELVFAVASDRPLPDLPRYDNIGYGMKQIQMNLKQIHEWFTYHAEQQGVSLSWDALPILTTQR